MAPLRATSIIRGDRGLLQLDVETLALDPLVRPTGVSEVTWSHAWQRVTAERDSNGLSGQAISTDSGAVVSAAHRRLATDADRADQILVLMASGPDDALDVVVVVNDHACRTAVQYSNSNILNQTVAVLSCRLTSHDATGSLAAHSSGRRGLVRRAGYADELLRGKRTSRFPLDQSSGDFLTNQVRTI